MFSSLPMIFLRAGTMLSSTSRLPAHRTDHRAHSTFLFCGYATARSTFAFSLSITQAHSGWRTWGPLPMTWEPTNQQHLCISGCLMHQAGEYESTCLGSQCCTPTLEHPLAVPPRCGTLPLVWLLSMAPSCCLPITEEKP